MFYIKSVICIIFITHMVNCQIPSFGSCPVFEPMSEFNKTRFLGTWYEVERYFTVTELASRCISVVYEKRADGRIWVNNIITNRFTGVQRTISGTLQLTGRDGEAKYNVQYTTFPVSYDTTLSVLDTDYKSYAVIYSCNSIGPVGHTQSVWVMARDRVPSGPILQRAYGVLDKYQISRTFFIKTDQKDCETREPAEEAYDVTTAKVITTTEKSNKDDTTDKPKKKSTIGEVVDDLSTTVKELVQRGTQNLIVQNDLKDETKI